MSGPSPNYLASRRGSLPAIRDWRLWVLLTTISVTIFAVFSFPPIPQSQIYHNFADKRALLGIPNWLNVVSNLLFLLVGWLGIRSVWSRPGCLNRTLRRPGFIDPQERWPYTAFFLAVAMTAFGSAYYHFDPRDGTLLWDRVPMATGFMALIAATIGERISLKAGVWLLVPFLTLGVGSVVYWDLTQKGGHGDLRPYALVQFGSVLVLLLAIALFEPRYTRGSDLIAALAIYALAKIFEAADGMIFARGRIVSGHTLKHIAAAISAYWILRMLQLRDPIKSLS